MNIARVARLFGLSAVLGAACASAAGDARPRSGPAAAETRAKDSIPERNAATRETSDISEPAVAEERFGTEEARQRRAEQKRREAARRQKVEVVEPQTKPKPDGQPDAKK